MRLTGIVALGLLAYLAALAAPIGLADLAAFGPVQQLEGKRAFPATNDGWIRGRDLLAKASELNPRSPNLADNLGQWYERAGSRLPPRSPQAQAHLRESLAYFRRAAAGRPSSPYTWSSIALVKARLGEVDDELGRAVVNSSQLGPWEPDVIIVIADVFFSVGKRLPPGGYQAGQKLLINGLRYQDDKIYEIAERYGQQILFCALPNVTMSKFAYRCI